MPPWTSNHECYVCSRGLDVHSSASVLAAGSSSSSSDLLERVIMQHVIDQSVFHAAVSSLTNTPAHRYVRRPRLPGTLTSSACSRGGHRYRADRYRAARYPVHGLPGARRSRGALQIICSTNAHRVASSVRRSSVVSEQTDRTERNMENECTGWRHGILYRRHL